MNEQQLEIKDKFNDQKLRFQEEKFHQQMDMKYQSLQLKIYQQNDENKL
jgi:hypothetical protein